MFAGSVTDETFFFHRFIHLTLPFWTKWGKGEMNINMQIKMGKKTWLISFLMTAAWREWVEVVSEDKVAEEGGMEDPHFNGVAKATTRPQGIWCSVKTAVPTVETAANGGSIRIQKPQMLLQMYLSTPSACCLILKGLESAFTEGLCLLSCLYSIALTWKD